MKVHDIGSINIYTLEQKIEVVHLNQAIKFWNL